MSASQSSSTSTSVLSHVITAQISGSLPGVGSHLKLASALGAKPEELFEAQLQLTAIFTELFDKYKVSENCRDKAIDTLAKLVNESLIDSSVFNRNLGKKLGSFTRITGLTPAKALSLLEEAVARLGEIDPELSVAANHTAQEVLRRGSGKGKAPIAKLPEEEIFQIRRAAIIARAQGSALDKSTYQKIAIASWTIIGPRKILERELGLSRGISTRLLPSFWRLGGEFATLRVGDENIIDQAVMNFATDQGLDPKSTINAANKLFEFLGSKYRVSVGM